MLEKFVLLTAEETGVPWADLDLGRRNPTFMYLYPPISGEEILPMQQEEG